MEGSLLRRFLESLEAAPTSLLPSLPLPLPNKTPLGRSLTFPWQTEIFNISETFLPAPNSSLSIQSFKLDLSPIYPLFQPHSHHSNHPPAPSPKLLWQLPNRLASSLFHSNQSVSLLHLSKSTQLSKWKDEKKKWKLDLSLFLSAGKVTFPRANLNTLKTFHGSPKLPWLKHSFICSFIHSVSVCWFLPSARRCSRFWSYINEQVRQSLPSRSL